MAYKIGWNKKAQTTFDKIVDYLLDEFGESSAKKFINKVNNFLELIEQNPEVGKIEVEEKSIRSWRVSKFTIAFYQVKNDHIFILKFFDGRQDPKKKLK